MELLYNAVGVAIQRETGNMASPMMKMSHEGFGRLVVFNKQLRDMHRFGFATMPHQELCIGCKACSKICPKKCYTHAAASV